MFWRLFGLDVERGGLVAPCITAAQLARWAVADNADALRYDSRRIVARCILRPDHTPPAPDCLCGFYAARERESLIGLLRCEWPRVHAEVELTQPVTIDPLARQHGVRAAGGTLRALHVLDDPLQRVTGAAVARLEARYGMGVPITWPGTASVNT